MFGISRKSLVGDFCKRTLSDATQPDKLLQRDIEIVPFFHIAKNRLQSELIINNCDSICEKGPLGGKSRF